jgi:hypothetical protein
MRLLPLIERVGFDPSYFSRIIMARWALVLWFSALGFTLPGPAMADKIKNPVAIFSGLDKITGRIISFEASIDETVEFGAFLVTPRVCYTRPITEPQNTSAFVEVDEIKVTGETKHLFGGWIFASSPGLNGVEHPIYDVWLIGCKGGTVVIPEVNSFAPAQAPQPLQPAPPPAKKKS